MTKTIRVFRTKKAEITIPVDARQHLLHAVGSVCIPLLFVMLTMMAGCGGGTSPSTTAVRDIQEGKAVDVAATLHALLVVDTNSAGDFGSALAHDLDLMNTLTDNIVLHTDMELDRQVFTGSEVSTFTVERAIEALSVGPDDVIIFYFSGHGGRTQSTASQWPDMYMQAGASINLGEVFTTLHSKGARLLLALSDSCNARLDGSSAAQPATQAHLRGRPEGYQRLFLTSRAAIIASSSVAGELSYMQSGGSLFTNQFLRAFSSEVSAAEPNWADLMGLATQHIQTAGVQQQPQHLLY